MKRPWHGAMPVTVTLPLGLERRLSARQRLWRRVAVGVLIALGAALLAAGFWLPASAERAQQSAGHAAISAVPAARARPLATLAVGDELVIARPDGSTSTYAVTALDVVDSERATLGLDVDRDVVVLVGCWPCEPTPAGGSWRYVVTARMRF